ncbi:MAG: hypothetical protein AB7V40_05285 [Methyloceanibacter sp.]
MRVTFGGASLVVAVAALAFASTAALADNCTWAEQSDGSQWGTCVDDNGRMYCQSCPAGGGACSVVSCSG